MVGRQARKLSSSGFYHVVFRGINRQCIFEENSDYEYFLDGLVLLKSEMEFEIHAYCLMSNHVHLLLKEAKLGDISLFMKRLLTRYAMYFNRKYQRSGTLIANRYKSEPVEVDEYFLPLIRYIHQNPVKAGLAQTPGQYRFSSYNEHLEGARVVKSELVLSMIGRDEFVDFHQTFDEQVSFEVTGKVGLSDDEVRRKLVKYAASKNLHELSALPQAERNEIIRQIKVSEDISVRQLERITGISRGIIAKC